MQKIRSILAYAWALMGLPIVLVTLMGSMPLGRGLAEVTGIKISPWQSGGEVIETLTHAEYRTEIYETVFDGLFGQRREGFVQIIWRWEGERTLPLEEEIDYDRDGQPDFRLQWTPGDKEPTLIALQEQVVGIREVMPLEEGLAVRVTLKRP